MNYDNYNLRGLKLFFLPTLFLANIGVCIEEFLKELTLKPYQMKQLFYILLASIFQVGITIGLVIIYSVVMKNYPEISNIALGLSFIAIWITEFCVLLGFVFKQK